MRGPDPSGRDWPAICVSFLHLSGGSSCLSPSTTLPLRLTVRGDKTVSQRVPILLDELADRPAVCALTSNLAIFTPVMANQGIRTT